MNYPRHESIRSSEIKEDELIDIVSKEFWEKVIYDEPEMPIKLCTSIRKEATGKNKKRVIK